jgi:rhamnosyltransferase
MEPTKLSVVIPTLNAAGLLEAQVNALRSQSRPPVEILVVDSGSTDDTAALARRLGVTLHTIEPGSFDHGATRNYGAGQANGDIIIFLTQDALPLGSETLERLVKPLEQSKVVVSYARQVPAANASPSEKYLRLANYPPGSMIKTAEDIPALGIKTFQNSNVCAAYRRSEFEALGRFPAPAVCNEDMLFAAKAIFAGFQVAYCAEALVSHTHQLSPVKLFRRYFDIAASLNYDLRIKALGKTEEKGLQFVKGQLAYLKAERKLTTIPLTILETAAKYLGYKAGSKHKYIPGFLKPFLGSNKLYWQKVQKSNKKPNSA